MKQILVPTDFSDNARPALDFAVKLAARFGAEITLYHVCSPSISEQVEEYVQTNAEQQLDSLLTDARQGLPGGVSLTGAVVVGEPGQQIVETARRSSYDLIVMGTRGEEGIKGFLMGSVTLEVVRRSQVPVLAIPWPAEYVPLHNIVLAIDGSSISSPGVLRPLRLIAGAFGARVRIYRQVKNSGREGNPPVPDLLVDAALEGVEHSFHQEETREEIEEGILRFAADQAADLICLIHRERGPLERWFHRSVTREELSNSSIPLLILHDER